MIPPLRFLADMNLSPLSVEALQREAWDIVRVSSLLPANAPDADILTLAGRDNYVIVTQDLDFSNLVALGGHTRPSLITLRLSNTDPSLVTQRLREVLPLVEQALVEGSAVTVSDHSVRTRRLPIR